MDTCPTTFRPVLVTKERNSLYYSTIGFPQGDLKAKESESRNKRMIAPTCESSAFHEWGDDTQNLTYMNQPPLFPSTFITSDKEPYDNIMTTNVQNVEILNKRYAFRVPVVDTIDSLWQLYSHSRVACVWGNILHQSLAVILSSSWDLLDPSSRPTHIYLMELPQKFLDNLSNNRLVEGAWQDLWHNFAKCSQRNHSSAQCCPRKTWRAFLDIWSCSTLRWRNSLPGIQQLRPWSAVALIK